MEADFQVIDRYLMVKMPEEIDHHQSFAISRKADSFLMRDQIRGIVFDFEDTKFMDSSGVIMGRYKKIACLGGRVFAIHADRQIRRILYISGLSRIMEIME
jgi:stage II sporulation protein AA (anti-sigma F factor antagonist)